MCCRCIFFFSFSDLFYWIAGFLISNTWNLFAETIGREVFDTIHIGNVIPYSMEYGATSSLWKNDTERKAIQKLQYNCLKVLCHGHVGKKFKVLGCFGQDAKSWWVVWCLYDGCVLYGLTLVYFNFLFCSFILLLFQHCRLNDELMDGACEFSKLAVTTNYDCIHWSCHYCNNRSVSPSQRKTMAAWIVDLGGPPNTNLSMYVNEY